MNFLHKNQKKHIPFEKQETIRKKRHWYAILGVFSVLIVCAAVIGLVVFLQILRGDAGVENSSQEVRQSMTPGQVDEILESFNQKKQQRLELLEQPLEIPDPSIF